MKQKVCTRTPHPRLLSPTVHLMGLIHSNNTTNIPRAPTMSQTPNQLCPQSPGVRALLVPSAAAANAEVCEERVLGYTGRKGLVWDG